MNMLTTTSYLHYSRTCLSFFFFFGRIARVYLGIGLVLHYVCVQMVNLFCCKKKQKRKEREKMR